MHASLVPILSGHPVDLPESRESVRKNAEIVLQQAKDFAALLRQFVAKDLDITRLWSFSGYGAFVAGSVFVVRSLCSNTIPVSALLCFDRPLAIRLVFRLRRIRTRGSSRIVAFTNFTYTSLPYANCNSIPIGLQGYDAVDQVHGPFGADPRARFRRDEVHSGGVGGIEDLLETLE